MASNQYFVCLTGSAPIPWSPGCGEQINKHTEYFGNVLRQMEEGLGMSGLTFYLTWDVDSLPSYGDDVVAVVLGDEWALVPAYADRVLAVFKCYGTRPTLGISLQPSYISMLATAQFVQAQLARVPRALRYHLSKTQRQNRLARVYSIPLGYANQVDLPIKEPSQRTYDVAFAGSIVHKQRPVWSPKRWLQTPKSLSRLSMVDSLQRLQLRSPDLRVGLTMTSGYSAIRTADPFEYSQLLMNTKVALAPRGTSFETFRFFEALRAGCIVVTEALPRRWFYDDAPVVRIRSWSELEGVVTSILSDESEVERRHRASLAWWREVCSEEVVGSFMRDALLTASPGAVGEDGAAV